MTWNSRCWRPGCGGKLVKQGDKLVCEECKAAVSATNVVAKP